MNTRLFNTKWIRLDNLKYSCSLWYGDELVVEIIEEDENKADETMHGLLQALDQVLYQIEQQLLDKQKGG